MMPNAKLTQANFEDMDALLADNFARAAKKQGVRHIVFMSGLIPNEDKLSAHLRSRLNVKNFRFLWYTCKYIKSWINYWG